MNVTALQPAGPSELVPTNSDPMMALIERASRDPSVDLDKMQRLLEMRQSMQSADAERHFAGAMTAAQSEMGRVATDSINPQTRSKYASYAQMDRALRPIYSRHGFSLSFNTLPDAPDGFLRVTCLVSHREGYSRLYQIDMPADGKGARGNDVMTKTHAVGSAASYAQRYLLKMIFNVAVGETDDDGNAVSVVHAPPPITATQVEELRDMIAERFVEAEREEWERKLCRSLKINSLNTLTADRFNDAKYLLKTKPVRA